MNTKYLFAFLLMACSFSLAAQKTAATVSEHGYRYIKHTNQTGPKAQRGQTVLATVDVFAGNLMMSSSRKNGGGYKYQIPGASEVLDHYPPIFDALLMMAVGDSVTIYQPVDTFMRRFLPPAKQNEKEIRFEIVLNKIVSQQELQIEAAAARQYSDNKVKQAQATIEQFQNGALNDKVKKTKSGLKIYVEVPGNGPIVKTGEAVSAHYIGMLKDGKVFDNSFARREPLAFPAGVGQMIAGFDEAILLLHHGAHAYIFVPAELGYGKEGSGESIPPNSDIVFYLEVI